MTFWAFGDSFMSYQENYIQILASSCKANNVKIVGFPGSGLLYTYQELLRRKDKIRKNDVVLIGLTSHTRHLFGPDDDWHVLAAGAISGKRVGDSTHKLSDPALGKAANDYYKYLYNESHALSLAHAVITSIFYSIIPSIKTDRISVVKTVEIGDVHKRFNLNFDAFKEPDLFHIAYEFLTETKGFDPQHKGRIIRALDTHNHWPDYDDYAGYFFNRIPRVLNELQIEKTVLPKRVFI